MLVVRGQGLQRDRTIGDSQHLHAVFQHFVHDRMHTVQTVRAEGMERTAVHHLTAPAADFVDAALDNEQIARLIFDQDTRAAAIVVKRQLVQLGVLHLKPV